MTDSRTIPRGVALPPAAEAPKRVDSPAGRYYLVGGAAYPSVTTVLEVIRNPFLERWRGAVGNEQADETLEGSGEFGTAVHAACEAYVRGELEVGDAGELRPWVAGFDRWFRNRVGEVVACEQTVFSDEHRFAGTMDLLVRLKTGEVALCDIKTSKRINVKMGLQLAAYRRAVAEQFGLLADRRLIVWLASDMPGTFGEWEFPDHELDDNGFLAALELWRWVHETGYWEH